jgi:hypothetical protein
MSVRGVLRNLAAFTKVGGVYPGYLSINRTDGVVTITVRNAATESEPYGRVASITLSTLDAARLFADATRGCLSP